MALENDKKEIENELSKLRTEVHELTQRTIMKATDEVFDRELSSLITYMKEERERTNKLLANIMDRIARMEQRINNTASEQQEQVLLEDRQEFPLSKIDTAILEMAQAEEMVCADDIKALFNYKGRNAASARLNNLRRQGLLKRHQIGHKVYFMLDADKATKIQIISPPQ